MYRKRAVTWPFNFYTIIWTLSVDYVEIDKACVKSYNELYGEDYKLKSVVGYKVPNENIDLIMHGSPCQDFSRIGKSREE